LILRKHSDLVQESMAVFSDCEKYRFHLERVWLPERPKLCYLMLNPSTADEFKNDPTIERCQRRAAKMGFGGIVIVNLFPYRLTDSTQLKTVDDLYWHKPTADRFITEAVDTCGMTICGWGTHPLTHLRAKELLQRLDVLGLMHKVHCLQITKDGSPQHPLYVSYLVDPVPYGQRVAA